MLFFLKQMPEAIWGCILSGVILYDFRRVVDELVFNSLGAGICCYKHYCIRICCVKVDDSGSGVLRDGLVLKGERYATSKFSHSDDMHAFPTSFGFKGEVLSLISDICLLEIVTKILGRPNGYHKFLKVYWTASVCNLELMIVDEMLTLFVMYFITNQFKGSKCTPNDLLCTRASPSPFPLLSSGFGIHMSSLNRLNTIDGSFWFSRYISGPDVYTVKVLQYFDINSRSVSKGPTHTLLNNIAMSSSELLTLSGEVDLRLTSKYRRSDDMYAFPASFGFKGEALSSISDTSLLEIVIDLNSREANGYRKVLKHKEGLAFSEKVSAMNHPCASSVSFKIVDIESEDGLLCTCAYPSSLLLLSSGFGIRLSSLNKFNASDGSFKLPGYTVKVNRPKLMDKRYGTFWIVILRAPNSLVISKIPSPICP